MKVPCEATNDSLPLSCLNLTEFSVPYIMQALLPNCENGSWTSINVAWIAAFYVHTSVFSVLFLLLGIACIVFLCKRHLAQRFKARTFVAIDVALAILGFSKVLFYILDPWGVSGYCTHMACMVISRLLFAVGFPSLTATYTLVFLTLWHSAQMRLGRACVQQWRVIIPLCFIHYIVAIVFELIGAFGGIYPILFLLISCEVVFALWGLFVCATFLVAGIRLLRSVGKSARQSSIVSRDIVTLDKNSRSRSTMRLKQKKQHKQAIRKVAIVTYTAAILGALYSLLNLVSLIMLCLTLFGECPSINDQPSQSADLWLALKYVGTGLELCMAVLLLYSINDIRPVVVFFQYIVYYIIYCGHISDENSGLAKRRSKLFSYEYSSDHESTKATTASFSSPVLTRKGIHILSKKMSPPPTRQELSSFTKESSEELSDKSECCYPDGTAENKTTNSNATFTLHENNEQDHLPDRVEEKANEQGQNNSIDASQSNTHTRQQYNGMPSNYIIDSTNEVGSCDILNSWNRTKANQVTFETTDHDCLTNKETTKLSNGSINKFIQDLEGDPKDLDHKL